MYKNKSFGGSNNIYGSKIKYLRKPLIPEIAQRALADQPQLRGLDLNKKQFSKLNEENVLLLTSN